MLETLYKTDDSDKRAFGRHWCGPGAFEHAASQLVAKYKPAPDGHGVEVYCDALPARFYTIRVFSGDEVILELQTGSDEAEMAAMLATKFATGMLGVNNI